MPEFQLSSRAVLGMFYDRLNANPGANWLDPISMLINSDQESESYAWLGMSPVMREWVGGRLAKSLREVEQTIRNLHFEATIDVPVRWLRRDKSGQVQVRINDLADRTNSHWASLLSTLIIAGESTVCYDGQYFFDTDHSEGLSGSQSNDLSVDISALGAVLHGVDAAHPGAEELQQVVSLAIQALLGFKDDQGEPMNENASSFLVMVPIPLFMMANTALTAPLLASGQSNIITNLAGLSLSVATNPRLTWTDKIAVFRTDGAVKPFIRQQETEVMVKAKAEGSEYEFDNDAHQYGVDAWRNVGYGYWQHAVLATMT
jgi:phage major head subunit gpT-like protein